MRARRSHTVSSRARAAYPKGSIAASMSASARSDDPHRVQRNRADAAAALGVAPDRLLTPYQVHSPDVVTVSDAPFRRAAACRRHRDGQTRSRDRRASLPIAGPFSSPMPRRASIGAAHAGWRGALSGVLENTIAAMEALGARRGAHRGHARTDDQPGELRGRARILCSVRRKPTPPTPPISPTRRRMGAECSTCPASSSTGWSPPGSRPTGSATAPMPTRNVISPIAATTHRNEPDYGRQLSAIALQE